jgi:hypothetical protein
MSRIGRFALAFESEAGSAVAWQEHHVNLSCWYRWGSADAEISPMRSRVLARAPAEAAAVNSVPVATFVRLCAGMAQVFSALAPSSQQQRDPRGSRAVAIDVPEYSVRGRPRAGGRPGTFRDRVQPCIRMHPKRGAALRALRSWVPSASVRIDGRLNQCFQSYTTPIGRSNRLTS